MLYKAVKWVTGQFRFPCQVRTGMLREAIEGSRRALGVRIAAAEQLKEYTDGQRNHRAFN